MSMRQVTQGEPRQKCQARSLAKRDNSMEQLKQGAVSLHLWEALAMAEGKGVCGGEGHTRGLIHLPFWAQTSGGLLGPGVPGPGVL